jgi:galactokinase
VSDTPDPVALHAAFRSHFGTPGPTLLVRAPGRVNLIGEHIDYNGLSVLPMAIQRHVALLVRPRTDGRIRIGSLAGFEPREFLLATDIPPYPVGDWGNYVKAAAQALEREHGPLAGFDAVLDSSVPVASGLSSSSALVIGVARGLLAANDLAVGPIPLAERMAMAERYTGTQGGGMDQAICAGAQPGTASRVDFRPLRITPIPVPPTWGFVVAYSLARAEKSGAAQVTYNRRTVECHEALLRVAEALGRRADGRTGGRAGGPASTTYPELLGTHAVSDLVAAGEAVLDPVLLRRFRHVVTEADRVARCEAALRADDLLLFGRLLSAGQTSLREDYEVSSPVLDQLTTIAEEAGAVGARLTGAGMGGCTVAAAPADRIGAVVAALAERFYARTTYTGSLDQHLFVARPSGGATVEEL